MTELSDLKTLVRVEPGVIYLYLGRLYVFGHSIKIQYSLVFMSCQWIKGIECLEL